MVGLLAWLLVFGTASPLWADVGVIPDVAGIYDGTVLVSHTGLYQNGHTPVRAAGIDAATGKILWRRENAMPMRGAPLLSIGTAVERIDLRTGRSIWRSRALCDDSTGIALSAIILDGFIYVGCSDGELFALQFSTGRVSASAQPISMHVDRIVSLGFDLLRVSGSDADASQSAIVKARTLSTVLPQAPDLSFLGFDRGAIVAADTCCRGLHEDNWPATIKRFSRATGKLLSSVDLYPYEPELPRDQSLPGGGSVLLSGTRLYVATHSALFQYNLRNLKARPRLLLDKLSGATIMDGRFFLLTDNSTGEQHTRIFDSHAARVVWSNEPAGWTTRWPPDEGPALGLQLVGQNQAAILRLTDMTFWRIDGDCNLRAANEHLALTACPQGVGVGPVRPSRLQMYRLQN